MHCGEQAMRDVRCEYIHDINQFLRNFFLIILHNVVYVSM